MTAQAYAGEYAVFAEGGMVPYFFAPVGREQLDVLGNPAGKALYGTEPIENMGNAIIRGMKVGAAGGGLGYLAGLMEQDSGWGRTGNGLLTGMAGKTASAFIPRRDPGKGCGGISPFLQVPRLQFRERLPVHPAANGRRKKEPGEV